MQAKKLNCKIQNGLSAFDSGFSKLKNFILNETKNYYTIILSTLIIGIVCNLFTFVNKLPNHDDLEFLLTLGASTRSGRWGLAILEKIIPPLSMPWLNGISSLAIMSIAMVILAKTFDINRKLEQFCLSGIIVSSPLWCCVYTFMFTSTAYAFSIFLGSLSIYLIRKNLKCYWLISIILLVLTTSLYQTYFSFFAALLVVLLIKDLREKMDFHFIVKKSFVYLAILLLSLAVYFITVYLSLIITDSNLGTYAKDSVTTSNGFIKNIILCFGFFFATYFLPSFNNVTVLSSCCNALILLLVLVNFYFFWKKNAKGNLKLLFWEILLLISFVFACTAYLLVGDNFHMLVRFSLLAFYFVAFVIISKGLNNKHNVRSIFSIFLLIIILSNSYLTNKDALSNHLVYEATYSNYTVLTAQIRMMPEYSEDTPILINGKSAIATNIQKDVPYVYEVPGHFDLPNAYSREKFFKYYLGADLNILSEEDSDSFIKKHNIDGMAIYPNSGSIEWVDGVIIVNLG